MSSRVMCFHKNPDASLIQNYLLMTQFYLFIYLSIYSKKKNCVNLIPPFMIFLNFVESGYPLHFRKSFSLFPGHKMLKHVFQFVILKFKFGSTELWLLQILGHYAHLFDLYLYLKKELYSEHFPELSDVIPFLFASSTLSIYSSDLHVIRRQIH